MIFINKEIVYVSAFNSCVKIGDKIRFTFSEHEHTVKAVNENYLTLECFNSSILFSLNEISPKDLLIKK